MVRKYKFIKEKIAHQVLKFNQTTQNIHQVEGKKVSYDEMSEANLNIKGFIQKRIANAFR